MQHMYANFKDKGHRSKGLKDDLWIATSVYIEFEFNIIIEKLKYKSKAAYDYIVGIKRETWVRHTFNTRSKVHMIVNNLYESLNCYILEARDTILTMIEWIRTTLMQRFQVK